MKTLYKILRVGGVFWGFRLTHGTKYTGKKCSGETETETETVTLTLGQPSPTTVENALSGQVDPRSVTAPTSPSAFVLVLVLIRPLSHCVV